MIRLFWSRVLRSKIFSDYLLALCFAPTQKDPPLVYFVCMPKKQKSNAKAELLELLKNVLPRAVTDPKLADKIYSACEKEISTKSQVEHFEKFCNLAELPSLEPESVSEVQKQFEESFGKGTVSIIPHPKKQAASVEVVVDDKVLEGVIKVGKRSEEDDGEQEFKPKFVPFPISLETDPELVWILGRGENLTPEEAAIQLSKTHDDFWASKQGQKLIRDRVERSFPEFISRVPAKMLSEAGLKRHYKDPEALKQLNPPRAG